MKTLKMIILIVTMTLLAPTIAEAQTEMSGAEKLNAAYTTAMKNSDLEAFMKLYTKDASIRNNDGSLVSGIDNIKAQYKDFLESGNYSISLEIIDETTLDNNTVFESGRYTFTLLDGEQSVSKGEFVNVLKKENNEWKIYKSYRYQTPKE